MGGSHFDYWSRCVDLKLSPEERLRYCRDMQGRGGGWKSEVEVLTVIGNAYLDTHDYAHALEKLQQGDCRRHAMDFSGRLRATGSSWGGV